jgi:hypothetical protein
LDLILTDGEDLRIDGVGMFDDRGHEAERGVKTELTPSATRELGWIDPGLRRMGAFPERSRPHFAAPPTASRTYRRLLITACGETATDPRPAQWLNRARVRQESDRRSRVTVMVGN